MQSTIQASTTSVRLLLAALIALGASACGGPSEPKTAATAEPASEATDAAMTEEQAAAAREEDLAAREAELALREKEVELQKREAELAAREAAAKKPASSTPKPAASVASKAPAPAHSDAAPPPPVTVPAGTAVEVKLLQAYSSKTTAIGDTVNAELASDLLVDGRRIARAGAPISGSVTDVTSGSRKIGAVPELEIDFTQLVVADGRTQPVAIRVNQKGASEKGRDTAKIVGGAAAGAIIGHQIDDDKGSVIGGLLGGAAGAVGAQKTGTEVEIAAGAVVAANVRNDFTYTGR
jgi:hypothetical protein